MKLDPNTWHHWLKSWGAAAAYANALAHNIPRDEVLAAHKEWRAKTLADLAVIDEAVKDATRT